MLTLVSMRAVIREVPEELLQERARKGWDRWDEVWEGVLHMVPPPNFLHQSLATKLSGFLIARLEARGIGTLVEAGMYRPGPIMSYRVPDLMFFPLAAGVATERGIEGPAHVVVEILSPNDETYEKFDFYAAMGVAEIVVIHPTTRAVELYRLAGSRYLATSADDRGRLHVATIDVRLATVAGPPPLLRVEHGGDAVEI